MEGQEGGEPSKAASGPLLQDGKDQAPQTRGSAPSLMVPCQGGSPLEFARTGGANRTKQQSSHTGFGFRHRTHFCAPESWTAPRAPQQAGLDSQRSHCCEYTGPQHPTPFSGGLSEGLLPHTWRGSTPWFQGSKDPNFTVSGFPSSCSSVTGIEKGRNTSPTPASPRPTQGQDWPEP